MTGKITVKTKLLHVDAQLPIMATEGAACFDVEAIEDTSITSKKIASVRTGLAFEIPRGYFLDVRPRSGLSKYMRIANSPGTLDSDYRGELLILMELLPHVDTYLIKKFHRIAQIRLEKVWEPEFVLVEELNDTERGVRGFGSTGH